MIPSRQSPVHSMNSMNSLSLYSSNGATPSSHHRPSPSPSSSSSSWTAAEIQRFLTELLLERQKLGPFIQVLPNCSRLLNQEIVRLSALLGTTFGELDIREPLAGEFISTGRGLDVNGWSAFQSERIAQQNFAWRGSPGMSNVSMSSPGHLVKKVLRVEVPIDRYPNFNFVGRLLGPRGNSLKRVESDTGCRVFIRGRGSIRDADKEEKLRDKPGYEHLNEHLHVLIEAEQLVTNANVIDLQLNRAREIIEDLLKPVEETYDFFKKQQLRELAMLNGTLREETPPWNGNASPFNNSGMKRAKTGG